MVLIKKLNFYFIDYNNINIIIIMSMTNAEEFNNLYELIKKNDIKDIINILDQNPEFINKTDSDGNTLLILACQYDNFELTKILIEKKADIHHRNNEGRDALLTTASTHGCVDLCKLLLENGANPNTADKLNHETPLFISAWFDNINLCLLFITVIFNPHNLKKYLHT
jgi:ankyrin repeat protein